MDITSVEREALATAMRNFGPCMCSRGMLCAGHRFLAEMDRLCSRLQRLIYVRRTAQMWQNAEWAGTCRQCGARTVLASEHSVCLACELTSIPVAPDAERLPW